MNKYSTGHGGKLAVWAIGIHREILKDNGLRVIRISSTQDPYDWKSGSRCQIEEKNSAIVSGGAEGINEPVWDSGGTYFLTASAPSIWNIKAGVIERKNWRAWFANAKSHVDTTNGYAKSWALALVPSKE